MARAKKTSESVPIAALTDESSVTVANPDGSLTTTHSFSPERVRRGDSWVPIDTGLVRRKDGSYAPRAAANVTFGGGKTRDLASMQHGRDALRFTWPTELPTPTVAGDTATYPEALPGVDLQVTADAGGYSSMIVVKTAQAAANPQLQKLDLGLTGTHVKITETAGGGAEATDTTTGETVFHANTALMWDSSPGNDAPPPAIGPTPTADTTNVSTAAPSGVASPEATKRLLTSPQAERAAATPLGGHRAQVGVDISAGKQTLLLDRGLLTAPTTKYPVFVDPDWSHWDADQNKWARISSNGWNVYNSTSKTGATSARIGYDDWPDGGKERARTYYRMDTSGIKNAAVNKATMSIVHRWSASCSNTDAVVYGTGSVSEWNSAGLSWGHEPGRDPSPQDAASGQEIQCGTSKVRPDPGTLDFDVTNLMKKAAEHKWSSAHLMVEAKNMNDKYSWKQLGYGGGATLSIDYSYEPTIDPDNGADHVFPSVEDHGKILTTTKTPTLSWPASNNYPNGGRQDVTVYYSVKAGGKQVASGNSPYARRGASWTVSSPLPDGEYSVEVRARNKAGLWSPSWVPVLKFTVDTARPGPPTIKSAQFPPDQVGAAFSDKGTFVLGVNQDKSNNVTGYLFSLDGDLSDAIYAPDKVTTWTAGTAIKPGTVYYTKADNGTGTVAINGTAAVTFAPGSSGRHTVSAKSVDQAGSVSGQTPYTFIAGTSSPVFVYGDQMINGWTATNADGSTTVVPKATTTSTAGQLTAQRAGAGYFFASGYQALLGNRSSSSTVANGDTATFWFNLPRTSLWEIGANLTTGPDYGTYSLTLDQTKPTETNLVSSFDAYSSATSTTYRNMNVIKDAADKPLPLEQGLHSITVKLTGKNGSSSGYQAGIDVLRLSPVLTCAINNTKDCLNNTAISTYTPGNPATVTTADADGAGWSLDAAELKSAGWAPGSTVTVHGAAIKLPATFGNGSDDNMLAAGQLVTVPSSGVINKGNAVVLVGFAVNGRVNDATGRIIYAKGSGCTVASQSFGLDSVPDWTTGTGGNPVLRLTHRNMSNATQDFGIGLNLFAVSVPLVCPGKAVASISLPLVSPSVDGHARALHVLGLGIRPTSHTGSGDTAERWVGSWAAAQDTGAIQASSGGAATLNAQTVRIPAHLSIGTGTDTGRIRVRLANSLGQAPVTIDAASIAPRGTGATAASTPQSLTFDGAKAVILPAGSDLTSDPVTLTAADLSTVLVSVKIRGNLATVPGHADGRTPVYTSGSDNADHTRDVDGAAYTTSPMAGLPLLAGIDVNTAASDPAGALVLYGDQTINSDTATADGDSQLDDQLAAALRASNDDNQRLHSGVLNLGSSASLSGLLPTVANKPLPVNAMGAVDRAILNQTDARIVLISAGTNDLLSCTATADACASTVNAKLNALAAQVRQYRADDALALAVDLPTDNRALKVYVATLPPFTASHTAVQEAARELVNAHILGDSGSPTMQSYADGVIDFAGAVSADGSAAGDTVKPDDLSTGNDGVPHPNDRYYRDLAAQYLLDAATTDGITGGPATTVKMDPIAVWKLDDGGGTTAADTGDGTGTGDDRTLHPAKLTDVGWGPGHTVDNPAGTFNGTSSYADTALPLNTTRSFTVSAWVRLTDKSVDRTVFTRDASGYSPLYFQYHKASDLWLAQMPSATSGDAVTWYNALSREPAKTGVWTHLAATYNAATGTLILYVNGQSQGTIAGVTTFTGDTWPTWIGHSYRTWFAGDIADVRVWERPLTGTEIITAAEGDRPTVDWQFEDSSDPHIAKDSSDHNADGAVTGDATFHDEGHQNPAADGDTTKADTGSMKFNGTNAAVTAKARLRTDQAFTVAAWVRLTDTSHFATAVSQDGAHSSGFQLQWGYNCKCWEFAMPNADAIDPGQTSVLARGTAPTNTWTHLVGVYDPFDTTNGNSTGTAKLYVNGNLASTAPAPPATWNATGLFTVGRSQWNDHPSDWFPGDIDDVRAYQAALTPEKIANMITD
ncbi:LamG-like jellyroll fold domain-containing protein [Krasilnikovia sp. MM14-A1004]|uniref:LamG-like jellyroll fold domain-containing protein n=1 Tax=Krasilnikovia sp. MM14-A1004 TaxID=3373541 RepID=UPI00399D2DCA